MKPIKVQALVVPTEDVEGEYLAFSTYDLVGQGDTPDRAKTNIEAVVYQHLLAYIEQSQPIPQPNKQLEGVEEITNYVKEHIQEGVTVVMNGIRKVESKNSVPELIFEFYKAY